MSDLVLLAGTAHPRLASAVARELGLPIGNSTVERFPGDGVERLHVVSIAPVPASAIRRTSTVAGAVRFAAVAATGRSCP